MWSRANALKDLTTIREIFDAQEIRFVLVWGTCLGFVRDKNFIKWDDDIDLMVPDDVPLKKRIELGKALEDVGFFQQDVLWHNKIKYKWEQSKSGYEGDEKSGIIVMQRHVKITVFFFEEIGEILRCFPRRDMLPLIDTPKRFFKKFDKIKHKGYAYNIPSPVREYLSSTYSGWEKPDKSEHGKVWTEGKTNQEIKKYIHDKIKK